MGEIVNISMLDQKTSNNGSSGHETPFEMRQGEVGYINRFDNNLANVDGRGGPVQLSGRTMDAKLESTNGLSDEKPIIPNPFVLETQMDLAILRMEDAMLSGDQVPMKYDPAGVSYLPPVPLHERLLPDMHLGWGKEVALAPNGKSCSIASCRCS